MYKKRLVPFLLIGLMALPGCGNKNVEEKNKKVAKKDLPQKGKGLPFSGSADKGKYFDEEVEGFALGEDVLVEGKDENGVWKRTAQGDSLEPVFFEFDCHKVPADQQPVVAYDVERVKELVEKDNVAFVVEGNADSHFKSRLYNVAKSQLRAEVIKEELINAGVAAEKVKTVGLGDAKKLVDVPGKERKNRRAEIVEVFSQAA